MSMRLSLLGHTNRLDRCKSEEQLKTYIKSFSLALLEIRVDPIDRL